MSELKSSTRITLTGMLFLLPAFCFVLFAIFIPTIWNSILSLQKWNGFRQKSWVGIDNYRLLIQDDKFWKSLYNSTYIAVGSTLLGVAVGLLLAILLFKVGKWEGAIFRLVFFMPVMLPLALIGLLFTFVYNPEMGLLNQFLVLIGADSLKHAWLSNSATVLICITIVGAWRVFGLTMMLCFAAIQSIPASLFEASKIDGASFIRQVVSIILPIIKPIIQLCCVFTLAISFKTYDLVWVMTKGGPGVLSQTVPINMLKTAFTYNEFGYSAAMGFILTLVVMIITVITRKALGGESHEY